MCLLVVIRLVKEETYNIMQLLFIALHVLAGMPTIEVGFPLLCGKAYFVRWCLFLNYTV